MSPGKQPKFEVRLRSRRVVRELDTLQGRDYRRVLEALRGLAGDPRPPGCEKLYDDVFRVRVGSWVIYIIDEAKQTVHVGGIRRRREGTYRGIDELSR